ncbi:MAG: PD-(D/E)XK nuclease family protein, partial [Proteobacteria bacterium]|nr:PD-(D/E)XK nuclease family protein [Pseudomonadota bacterium]
QPFIKQAMSGDGESDRLWRGNYVHQAIDLSLKRKSWVDPLAFGFVRQSLPEKNVVEAAILEAKQSYDFLQNYLAHADDYLPEVSLCGLAPDGLITGKADLVVTHEDRVEIIDYKSISLLFSGDGELAKDHDELKEELVHRGYDKQLDFYRQCLSNIHRDKPIVCSLFLTKNLTMVQMIP